MPPIYLTSDLLSYKRSPNLLNPIKKTLGDPYIDNVVLYLKGDGADGSTSIIDESPTPKSISVFGNAQISTAQSKYGGSSLYFDGTADYLTTTDPEFGVEDFAIESWVYSSIDTSLFICSNVPNNSSTSYFFVKTLDSGNRLFPGGDQYRTTPEGVFPVNQWNHIAFTRQGDTLRHFINGVLAGSIVVSPVNLPARTLIIGGFRYTGFEAYFNGYLDSVRITKGVARYTANFDPETDTFLAY